MQTRPNKENNGDKSSCLPTNSGHHALTLLNPLFPPTEGNMGAGSKGEGEEAKGGLKLHS